MSEEMKSITCAKCGRTNIATAKFCGGCGSSFKLCPKCESVIQEGCAFCNECGYQISVAPAPKPMNSTPVISIQNVQAQNTPVTPAKPATPVNNGYNRPIVQPKTEPSLLEKLLSYPGLWVAVIAFSIAFILSFQKIVQDDFLSLTAEGLLSYSDWFVDSDEMHWLAVSNYYCLWISLALGCGCIYILYNIIKNQYASYFNFTSFSALFFFGAKISTVIFCYIMADGDLEDLGLNASFFIGIVAYIVFLVAFVKTIDFLKTTKNKITRNQEWTCNKCGTSNSYLFTRCQCGQLKSDNY